jgi:hypothetical protein
MPILDAPATVASKRGCLRVTYCRSSIYDALVVVTVPVCRKGTVRFRWKN